MWNTRYALKRRPYLAWAVRERKWHFEPRETSFAGAHSENSLQWWCGTVTFAGTARSCATWRRTRTMRRRKKKRSESTHTLSGPAAPSAALTPTGRAPYSSQQRIQKRTFRARGSATFTRTPLCWTRPRIKRRIPFTLRRCTPNALVPTGEEWPRWVEWTTPWGAPRPQTHLCRPEHTAMTPTLVITSPPAHSQTKPTLQRECTITPLAITQPRSTITIIMCILTPMSFLIKTDRSTRLSRSRWTRPNQWNLATEAKTETNCTPCAWSVNNHNRFHPRICIRTSVHDFVFVCLGNITFCTFGFFSICHLKKPTSIHMENGKEAPFSWSPFQQTLNNKCSMHVVECVVQYQEPQPQQKKDITK